MGFTVEHSLKITDQDLFNKSRYQPPYLSAIEAIRNGETNISCDILTLLEQLNNKRKSCILQWIPAHVNIEGHEDSPRQDKIICSMQTLPRSSTDAQSHFGMPNRRNKVTKNGNGPSEGLFAGAPVQPLMLPE
ncbi:hypothetical protein TNCV_4983901 [Trichonephila clavipes]|nr:hypothetical protein TNCV_4983901 [Trichonephila clavipes]